MCLMDIGTGESQNRQQGFTGKHCRLICKQLLKLGELLSNLTAGDCKGSHDCTYFLARTFSPSPHTLPVSQMLIVQL